jgi:hypothetical protein
LSAFTWALGRELDAGGAGVAAAALRDRVSQRLAALNMGQTPVVEAPMAHGGWLTEALITYGAAGGTTTPSGGDEIDAFLRSLGIGVGARP